MRAIYMNNTIELSQEQKIKIGQKIHNQRIKNDYSIAELEIGRASCRERV